MSGFFKEFKDFISRGNVMDMAIGVIIGGAFTAIVTSLTTDILQPFIHIVSGGGTEVSGMDITVGDTTIGFSNFISAIINFLIIALIVFLMVKAMNKFEKTVEDATKKLKKQEEEAEAAAPICPHCLEEVKEGATRCPHCAGEIPGGAHASK
ncbi:MAG: large conductance mechanosensitive channel protein MscL [Atopobiaceae bacterium]|jgi:large conductance mechanosensitive channel